MCGIISFQYFKAAQCYLCTAGRSRAFIVWSLCKSPLGAPVFSYSSESCRSGELKTRQRLQMCVCVISCVAFEPLHAEIGSPIILTRNKKFEKMDEFTA